MRRNGPGLFPPIQPGETWTIRVRLPEGVALRDVQATDGDTIIRRLRDPATGDVLITKRRMRLT